MSSARSKPSRNRSAKTLAQRAITVFARNGLNTLLLDIKEDVTFLLCEMEAIHRRLDTLEPQMKTLHDERSERIGAINFLTSWRAWVVTIGAGGIATVWHFFGSKP